MRDEKSASAFQELYTQFYDSAPITTPIRNKEVFFKSEKVDDCFYLPENTPLYKKIAEAITDDNQIYRFSDYGIQKSKDGICFTLKANMGTWYNRVPIINDYYGIRTITPEECLRLMGFPRSFKIADIPLKSAYKQIGNSVCVPVIKLLAENILGLIR